MNTPAISKAISLSSSLKMVSPIHLSGFEGKRLGKRTGNALEFAEYRDYQPGDDIRRLDWGVFARKEQLMVRQFNEEVDPRCDIILDCSASMVVPAEKADYAVGLAALLSQAASNAGFSFALWYANQTWRKEEQPERPLEWSDIAFDSPASPGETIYSFSGKMHQRGIRIVISDFLWPHPPSRFLRRICDGAQKSWLLRMDFPVHLSPQNLGMASITDAETGEARECVLDEQMMKRYNQLRSNHLEMWNREAAHVGVDILDLPLDALTKDLATTLLIQNNLLTI
ncbi:MAG: DUF58 domain-containing protein [Victivallales bacterium]|nr:DUF58 domain-containing protein [Victivallales bacterium]